MAASTREDLAGTPRATMTTMHRGVSRWGERARVALACGVALSFSSIAHAKPKPKAAAGPPGPKDKVVLKLDDEALGKDYLETNFIKAEKKLQQAIRICANKACSDRVLGLVHRDLAVVYIAGLGKVDAGKAELKAALEADPNVELDADYATPELKKIFNQLRGKGKAVEEPKAAKTGITHAPVTEQAVATPVPIYAEFSGADSAKLRVWYRTVGAERWSSVIMVQAGSGFTAEIPCSAAPKTGELRYFIEALGESDETLDKDGSRSDAHVVSIVKELAGDAPHFPDASPPDVCKNLCEGDDCAGGEDKPKGPRTNWLSISVEQDLGIVGAGTGVCTPEIQVNGSYSCFRATGSQYHGFPVDDPGDNVNGGLSLSTTRILIGYERVLVAGLVLGIRLGYVMRGLGPRADGADAHAPTPFHVEGRLAYWFGKDVFSTNGARPYLFAAGGMAQMDVKFGVVVHECTPQISSSCPPPSPSQTDNPPAQRLDAYRRMGQGFVGGGVGLMYAFTPGVGLFLDAKYMHLLPTAGNALSPEFGIAVGF